jgi:hypothetical protein
MPRTRQPKRTNSASSTRSEKHTKKVNKLPTGENKAGLTPAIRFCDAVKDEDDKKADFKYIIIKVKINQDKLISLGGGRHSACQPDIISQPGGPRVSRGVDHYPPIDLMTAYSLLSTYKQPANTQRQEWAAPARRQTHDMKKSKKKSLELLPSCKTPTQCLPVAGTDGETHKEVTCFNCKRLRH